MSRRLWLLHGWLSGWWLEKRCALGGHVFVYFDAHRDQWSCRCRARTQTSFQFLQELTRS